MYLNIYLIRIKIIDTFDIIVTDNIDKTMRFTREDYNKRITDTAGKIPEDEPVFLLRAQDVYAPSTLRYYARLLEEDGNLEMAEELRVHARQMVVWQKSVRVHLPDK
jgi:hypothetical protein